MTNDFLKKSKIKGTSKRFPHARPRGEPSLFGELISGPFAHYRI